MPLAFTQEDFLVLLSFQVEMFVNKEDMIEHRQCSNL